MESQFKSWGFFNSKRSGSPRILLAAGHGYGNVGDEAQCGAAVARWRKYQPGCKVTLFSPNPGYTEELHREEVAWAPRVGWFCCNSSHCYDDKHPSFYKHFKKLKWRILLSAHFLKRGIPLSFLRPREAVIFQTLLDHDILHISGGGFLTGKTRSRLWENCLLMRVCQILGIPYVLTGHNIGVFQDERDRRLAHWGLKGASYIGLRDKGISERELKEIGIHGERVESSCDDALLCPKPSADEVTEVIRGAGADPGKPWVAVNFHYWGQPEEEQSKNAARFAQICDELVGRFGLQVVFIAMTPTDVEPERAVKQAMVHTSFMIPYSPDYRVVRGVIAFSHLCFTMKHHPIVFAQGELIPVVCVALESYYEHKNRGALANTGDTEAMVTLADFHSDKVLEIIKNTMQDQDTSRARKEQYLKKMYALEKRIYERFSALL